MNALTNTPATMTSLELVQFINNQREVGASELRHDDFMRKAPKVLGQEGVRKFSDTYAHPQNGQNYPCYRFPKREACLMAMSYSYELQAKVFDRMTELEAQTATLQLVAQPLPDFSSPAQAARAWAEQFEQREQLALAHKATSDALAVAEPKASAFDLIQVADGDYTITVVAKMLNITPHRRLFDWMNANRWTYKSAGHGPWLPHVERIQQGYMVLGGHLVRHNDGRDEEAPQARVTAKGLARLGIIFSSKQEAA